MNHSTTSHHDETTTPRPMSFITMTDILNAINNNNNNNHCSSTSCFELQRRLPDGSTRKASPSEQAAADCQTRLQQACQLLTTTLSSQDERYEWAETQRHYGNQLYQQQQYEHAIQVYLTCLPAVARIASNQEEEEEENRGMETNEQQQQQEQQQRRLLLYGKIMNNLAQSCLQLQWYRKAETFCTMALDYLQDYNNKDPIVISKLYYRRGKARRCRGEFGSAKADLERAFEYAFNDTTRAIIIQNELNQVHQKAVQAKRNHQQHKIALQKVMQSTTKKNNNGVFISQSAAPTNNRRPYSTLRATSRVVENPTTVEDTTTELSSYWQYYMSIVGKVAAALLSILEQQQQQQHHQLHEKIE